MHKSDFSFYSMLQEDSDEESSDESTEHPSISSAATDTHCVRCKRLEEEGIYSFAANEDILNAESEKDKAYERLNVLRERYQVSNYLKYPSKFR